MTTKADFTAEEWSLLRQAPTLAGLLVLVADTGGTLREAAAIAQVYGDAHESWWGKPHGSPTLIEELLADGPELDRSRFGSPDRLDASAIEQSAVDCLRQAKQLVEQKAGSAQAEAYAQFVCALARRVAEAHKEGSFLGIGGTRVSAAEQTAIDRISAAIGVGATQAS
jgi:hypothetical protein